MATTSPDNIWTPDLGDEYALTVDLATMADTVQDAITSVRGYVDSEVGDVEAQIPPFATQSAVDSGTSTQSVVSPATLRGANYAPWAMSAGFVSSTNLIGAGSGRTLTVSLPAGRFTQAPIVLVENAGSSRLTTAVINRTTTNFQVRQDNFSGGTASGQTGIMWVAVQMTSGAAAG